MLGRSKSRKPPRWLDALRPDADLAQAEGLAAGTGLLTGSVARSVAEQRSTLPSPPCPTCAAESEIVVVDLIVGATTRRCQRCSYRWTTEA